MPKDGGAWGCERARTRVCDGAGLGRERGAPGRGAAAAPAPAGRQLRQERQPAVLALPAVFVNGVFSDF